MASEGAAGCRFRGYAGPRGTTFRPDPETGGDVAGDWWCKGKNNEIRRKNFPVHSPWSSTRRRIHSGIRHDQSCCSQALLWQGAGLFAVPTMGALREID